MSQKHHWDSIYASNQPQSLGWYKPRLCTSIEWISELGLELSAPVIDIGTGASTLIDDLQAEGYTSLTGVDISANALAIVQARLGDRSDQVSWLCGDITSLGLAPEAYAVWHDRAVFHFLIDPERQEKYRRILSLSLKPGGHLVMGVFAPEAPPRCSGLPLQRYDFERLHETLGPEFSPQRFHKELHITPGGIEQMYLYVQFQKVG